MFFGRTHELAKLQALLSKKTASLVVLKGRRRIGKSSLIEKFGASFDVFCSLQGLAPRPGLTEQDQLRNVSEQMSRVFKIPALTLNNWTDAFAHLASHTRQGKTLILLDEISWMGNNQPDFAGKLKIAWDTQFKNNPRLILVLCGSVSSWIEKNILKDADFVGRVSLEIDLQELPLHDCQNFWGTKKSQVSAQEKLKVLSALGGVPKYLEEINPTQTAEQNIRRLFFERGAPLLKEFDKIFNEIFNKRAPKYKEIVSILCAQRLSVLEIAKKIKTEQNGDVTEYLADLEASGFIRRDYVWKFDGKKSKISKYRIKDNYLRFYLKYVESIKEKIESGLFEFKGFDALDNWPSILGFQFENLVLHNLESIIQKIGVDVNSIVSASPYFQNKTRVQNACQIDLLIHTKFSTLYVCEMKFRKAVGSEVVSEVQKKISLLKRPKNMSVRPVLIYEGELSEAVAQSNYFDKIICFGDLLKI